MDFLSVSDVARAVSARSGHTISPQTIANLFYKRKLDDDHCPVVGRGRLIPPTYVPTIEAVLREHGYLPQASVAQEPSHAS